VPLQKPHPPIWIPGTGSAETAAWCAEHHYPYFYLGIVPYTFGYMQDIYRDAARMHGYEAGPQNFGYMLPIHVQDTDEKAKVAGRGFLEALVGVGRVAMPREYSFPPGYNRTTRDIWADDEREAQVRATRANDPFRTGPVDDETYQSMIDDNRMVIGSPDTVIRKVREVLEMVRPGILAVWTNDGSITHKDTMRCLELMDQEVLPAIREIGDELELPGPFDVDP